MLSRNDLAPRNRPAWNEADDHGPVDEQAASTLFKLLDVLDDNDDVQRVSTNFDVDEEVMERLSADGTDPRSAGGSF
jgi:hypothetical protein